MSKGYLLKMTENQVNLRKIKVVFFKYFQGYVIKRSIDWFKITKCGQAVRKFLFNNFRSMRPIDPKFDMDI